MIKRVAGTYSNDASLNQFAFTEPQNDSDGIMVIANPSLAEVSPDANNDY